ncbi:MAG TPA: hypothetical protein ENK47_09340 [Euryarchaeota archaeon]|nr:hypothetical protein [Euryarchaeota archaeon]
MSRTNLSWEFTTHPCRGHPDGTDRILRPMMPATISKGNDKIDVPFLVDSGADFPSIPRDLAEALSINIDDLPKDKISGVGGISDIAWVDLDIEFGQRGRQFSYRWPFQVILNNFHNKLPLVGREPLFLHFDVSFRMKYAGIRGKFVLSEVIRTRDPGRYC